MGIEAVVKNGCPNCQSHILIKLEPNSVDCFQFDACPSCGFIEFEAPNTQSTAGTTLEARTHVWGEILLHYFCRSLTELKNSTEEYADNEYKTVFNYSEASPEYLKSCTVTQAMIDSTLPPIKEQ